MANTAAQRLGRRGGKATASKRTVKQRSEAARKAATARWIDAREDRKPNTFIFELVLSGRHPFYTVLAKMRKYNYSDHRIVPLLRESYVVPDPETSEKRKNLEVKGAQFYKATAKGIDWWVKERAAHYENSPHCSTDPTVLIDENNREPLQFKGMGVPVTFYLGYSVAGAVFAAMRNGLLEFISHRDYSGFPHTTEEYVTASLTKKGYEWVKLHQPPLEVWK